MTTHSVTDSSCPNLPRRSLPITDTLIPNIHASHLHDCHDVIDLEDHPDTLGGQLESARVNEYRLDHVLCVHIADSALAYVDT